MELEAPAIFSAAAPPNPFGWSIKASAHAVILEQKSSITPCHSHPPLQDIFIVLVEIEFQSSENDIENCYHGPKNAHQSVHLPLHRWLIPVSFHLRWKHQGKGSFSNTAVLVGKIFESRDVQSKFKNEKKMLKHFSKFGRMAIWLHQTQVRRSQIVILCTASAEDVCLFIITPQCKKHFAF